MTQVHARPAVSPPSGRGPRGRGVLATLAALAAFAFLGLVALGNWQIERRAWKLDLIERVQSRVHAEPVPAPGPAAWPQVSAAQDEYRRVQVAGVYAHDQETLVQAVSALGSGFWVLTPLRRDDGSTVLVNRGFVPPERRDPATRGKTPDQGPVTVTGLLRMTEPEGGFLRKNDPAADRWHSRDVQAIAQRRGLDRAAPYFIDADASASDPQGWPVAGLTVLSFRNHHLVYALTWYTLALMVAGAAFYVARDERRLRRQAAAAARSQAGASPHGGAAAGSAGKAPYTPPERR
ncbi:SURF1 family protein [Orrella sp. JC864]|uniref:SURF1 family protein n=1 Tax=Orrella sp. JC864 TaxID=3120298 RepID=UPI0012BBC203